MSLFEINNWWTAQCPDLDENYDVHNLLCTCFGTKTNNKDYIVVGSHGGYLSVYSPNATELADGDDGTNRFKQIDLLYETRFEAPILGLYSGNFTSSNNSNEEQAINQLVVLHPFAVAIYKVHISLGMIEHGSQMNLQMLSEHHFQQVAFYFCNGHFGQIEGREFFCVAHIDGSLTFFEQDGISYQCAFPQCRNILSPLVYCERTDSFIRFTSNWTLECYTYQDLAQSSFSKAHYQPIWTICLGEILLDMRVARAKQDHACILLLGEHNFVILKDTGKVEQMLKLDFSPKCFYSFVIGYFWEDNARLITAIFSQDARLHIYEYTQLIWAAKYTYADVVSIQRASIMGLPGNIVTLGAFGSLNVGYLGSKPVVFIAPAIEQNEINFDDALKELLLLEEKIKESMDVQNITNINAKTNEDVRMHFNINPELCDSTDAVLLEVSAAVIVKEFMSATAQVRLKINIDLAELQLVFTLPEGIHCNLDASSYNNLKAGTSKTLDLQFYIADLLHVASAKVVALVSYVTQQGIPRVIERSAYLPLNMFFKFASPQKSSALHLTFDTIMDSPLRLANLFPEFLDFDAEAQALGLGLLCPGELNQIVTIVLPKNSERLRIQSDSLEALTMIIEHILQKFNKLPADHAQRLIRAAPELPVYEILHRLDQHHDIQYKIRQQMAVLDDLWQQYKTLQLQMQDNFEAELKETQTLEVEQMYDQLILEGDKLMAMRKEERCSQCNLTCAMGLAKFVICTLDLAENILHKVCNVLCTPIVDWMECSWEEAIDPSIEMLHNYEPLIKQQSSTEKAQTLIDRFEYQRFRKHLSALFERLLHLAKLSESNQLTTSQAKMNSNSLVQQSSNTTLNNQTVLRPLQKAITLPAPADIAGQIQKVGKQLETIQQNIDNATNEPEEMEKSDWVNENYQLPSSEELFSDLGIWW